MATGTEVFDAGRGEHAVLFYRDEKELAERVSGYLRQAVQGGEVAIVLATAGHHRAFQERLADAGADVATARARGSYLALDASETIRGFMVTERPDPAAFWQAIDPLLRRPAEAGQPIRIFGEMVSLLWDAGLAAAAIELELMWEDLRAQYPFSLLCAYPAQSASCAHHLDALTEVCRIHTEVIGGPPG